jgi:hypothetical protein
MELLIKSNETTSEIAVFELRKDGGVVDVYVNDILIGWFDTHENNKIRFKAAFLAENSIFAVDKDRKLATS